jgi:hypothetical protein
MMKVATVSRHAVEDRMERMMNIARLIGWGEEVLRVWSGKDDAYLTLTSTGIIIVKSSEDKLITAYVAHHSVVMWMYREVGYTRVPYAIYSKVVKNEKYVGRW